MAPNRSPSQSSLLDGEQFNHATHTDTRKKGTLFIEARLKDGMLESGTMTFESCEAYGKVLEATLTEFTNVFELLEDILADKENAILKLGKEYENAKATLESLKVIEYIGPTTVEKCFVTNKVELKVQVFQLHGIAYLDKGQNEAGMLGEVVAMPNARFEGVWDELVFDHELKADLIWMMTNILRFSKAFEIHKFRRKLNPLILLHGPPGTGKTSLCLGLAQKISIRLSSTYKSTKLVQVKTAVLLSKYYSESAKHVDDIFNMIISMCEERPDGFICVLIDEVESIASSREFSTQHGESLDSMRATNALLTGLDRATSYSNVVFLFTSNMADSLEPAFLDRCGLREFVGPPSMAEQYEILRSVLERLTACHVIQPSAQIPQYNEAILDAMVGAMTSHLPGCKLIGVVKLIQETTSKRGNSVSGRYLGQLPEKALMRYLRGEECDLDLALELLRRCVIETLRDVQSSTDETKFEVEKMRDWKHASDSAIETGPESVDEEQDLLDSTTLRNCPEAVELDSSTKNAPDFSGEMACSPTVNTASKTVDRVGPKRKMNLEEYQEFLHTGRKKKSDLRDKIVL